jgi:mannose-6-phosphate isomerase-like protein (cupin superfamily)
MEAEILSPRVQAAIVTPGQARTTGLFALATDVLLSTGALSVSMACHKPGEGLREQVHLNRDEMFFVVEGTYQLTADDRTCTAGPGTVVLIPCDVVHRLENVGTSKARMLDWSLPCKQGLPFKTIAELATSSPDCSARATSPRRVASSSSSRSSESRGL